MNPIASYSALTQLEHLSTTDYQFQYFQTVSSGKRDLLKKNRLSDKLFSGPYEGPILSTAKYQFIQDYTAFQVPDHQKLSILHVIFTNNALRCFTDNVKLRINSVEEAFKGMKSHFITDAHINAYITECNGLKFIDFKTKYPAKSPAEILDKLYYRAQDLQLLLESEYQSKLLLRDCIIRAVKDEPFYTPLTTIIIPKDPDELHTIVSL